MRREELYLADLVDNARAVRGYLDGVTRERWDAEDILRDAVLYRMLLPGEIAGVLPDELRDRYPNVAWRQVRAFRNLAVHKYFGVDWAVVWKIAQEEPAVLEAQVLAIISAEYPALAKDYEAGPDPGPASLRDHGRRESSRGSDSRNGTESCCGNSRCKSGTSPVRRSPASAPFSMWPVARSPLICTSFGTLSVWLILR
jgi:uncharacterized protein with HEPN domain